MRGKRNKKRHLIKSMDKPNEKKAFSFPLERDYRRAEPSSDEKAVEFVRSLREKGFFTLYEAMCARMTRVVVPEHQAAFERLVGLLGGDGQHHADAHIEGVEHIVLVDAALFLEQTENGGCFDLSLIHI